MILMMLREIFELNLDCFSFIFHENFYYFKAMTKFLVL